MEKKVRRIVSQICKVLKEILSETCLSQQGSVGCVQRTEPGWAACALEFSSCHGGACSAAVAAFAGDLRSQAASCLCQASLHDW